MPRIFLRPTGLASLLLFLTFIPILAAGLRMYQIPTGQLPLDAAKFTEVPWSLFAHALGGLLFGLLGPVQFTGILKRRFGRLHRVTGRLFVVAGLLLALSLLRLLAEFPTTSTWILVTARLMAASATAAALILAVDAVRRHNITQHKAWMVRANAIGMGSATISFIMLPIFLVTGEPVEGYTADFLFVASWVINVAIAEWVIRKTATAAITPRRKSQPPAQPQPLPTIPHSRRFSET